MTKFVQHKLRWDWDYWYNEWVPIVDYPRYKVNRSGEVWDEWKKEKLTPGFCGSYRLWNEFSGWHKFFREDLVCGHFNNVRDEVIQVDDFVYEHNLVWFETTEEIDDESI